MVADATATGADDTLAGSTAAAGSKIESTEGELRPLPAPRDDAPERIALETGNPKPETEEQLRTPPPSEALANTSTVTTPSPTSPASDLADNRTSGSERPSSDISPEQALAGLANTENLSQTPTAQLGETGSGRAAETRDVSTSVAIVSGDTETAALPPPSRPIEATPSKDSDRSELPPGIRQALRSSNDQPTAVSSGESGGSRLYRVQLAAFHNVRAAEKYWREVNQRLPGVFTDVEPIYNERVDDERAYLRIWVGAFENRLDADGYCGWLKQRGQDCFVTRVDNL